MNKELLLNLNTISKAQRFVRLASEFTSDIDLVSGRYVIDAKSIMGVFSVNLLEPLLVRIVSNDVEEIESFNRVMEEFKYE